MHYRFFWLKYLAHLENLGVKNASRFFTLYAKQKINFTWPKQEDFYELLGVYLSIFSLKCLWNRKSCM